MDFTIEIVLIIYITITRLYFEYSFLSYTFVIGIIISATTAYRLWFILERWLGYGFKKNMGIIVKEKLLCITLSTIYTVYFWTKRWWFPSFWIC